MAFLEEVVAALASDGETARYSIVLARRFVHKSEWAKRQAFDMGVIKAGLALLRSEGLEDSESKGRLCGAIATLLRGVVTHDDLSTPKTRCFDNARELGGDGTTIPLLFDAVAAHRSRPRAVEPLLDGLRALAVNNEICEDMEDRDVLRGVFVQCIAAQLDDEGVCRAACAMVKQLANADSNKRKAMRKESAPFKALLAVINKHRNAPHVLETAVAAVANVILRQPDSAEKAVEMGVVPLVAQALKKHPGHANLCRQCCLALRNIVSRCPELRAVVLEEEVEAPIRAAKRRHSLCDDVGKAAIRDLGLD